MAAETVSQAITDIRNMDNLNELDEARTKLFIVERLLEDLGWNLRSPKEVEPEYRVGKDKADYALNPNSPTTVFIEAKKTSVNLEGHQGQLLRYCFDQTVNLGVLTNGRIWWLYLPRYEGPQEEGLKWAEKRFCEIDITSGGPAKIQKEFDTFLAKDNVLSGDAIKVAKDRINGQVEMEIAQKGMRDAWNNVLTAPSEDLIKLLTESTASVCGVKPNKKTVTGFFQNHRSQLKVSDVSYPRPKPATNGVDSGHNGKPSQFRFKDKPYRVGTWKEVLVKLCEVIYVDPDRQVHFDRIMNVRGAKKPYFSGNPDDLESPQLIGNSGIFAATYALNAVGVEKRCRKVLQEFNYGPEAVFTIE